MTKPPDLPAGPELPTGHDLTSGILGRGTDTPPLRRRQVRAGPFAALVEGGFLRYVTLDPQVSGSTGPAATPSARGAEVVRGVYGAVRDHNWGTVEPRYTAYAVEQTEDTCNVRFTAEHLDGAVDFVWQGAIDGAADGTLTYRFDGVARSRFRRNRIGLCLLHPMHLAGEPVEVETPQGTVAGVFPAAISPHQPFYDVVAIRQRCGDATVEVRFEGDLFEMEDQRNWTDASYKTYGTPLRLPYPVEVPAGTRVQQSITIRLLGSRRSRALAAPPTPRAAAVAPDGAAPTGARPVGVQVAPTVVGTLPPIGLGAAGHGEALTASEAECLRRLRPAHLRATIDIADASWTATLDRAAGDARAIGAGLELELLVDDASAGEGLSALGATLQRVATGGVPIDRVLVFPRAGVVTTAPAMAQAREVLRAAGVTAPLGGGTRADFVNLNRATLPLHLMDVVAYAISPQVHAFDDLSLVETLPCQGVTVADARRIAGGAPVCPGPMTFKQRLNPAATGSEAAPRPDDLSPQVDPRQLSLFGAGWTLGSVTALACAGAASLTYFETTGRCGVMAQTGRPPEAATGNERRGTMHPLFPSPPGMLFPVYHVFAALAPFAGAELLGASTDDPPAVTALALAAGGRVRVILANLTGEARRVTLAGLDLSAGTLRFLDQTTAPSWLGQPGAFALSSDGLPSDGLPSDGPGTGASETFDLLPYALAVVDARLA